MNSRIDLHQVHEKIQLLKRTAEELNRLGEDFPSLDRNTVRILASLKMLELNVSDIADLELDE